MIKFGFKILKWPALIAILLGALAWFYPEKFLTVDSGPVTADVLIVVGGGQHERALRAAQLYQLHTAPRIIVTGAGDDQMNRRLLLANGVPPQAIEVEGKSTTTCENAKFTGKLLRAEQVRSAILVTSWYHARRAEKTFAHFVPEVRFYSRPTYYGFDRADWQKYGTNRRMRLEFLKLPGYWIRYGVNPF
ncbi:MAG: YdcF family protein [Verrucomicrobiota bacterium]|jgi:uncharacterized SAM-binding protein YcdF (DUF218 family)